MSGTHHLCVHNHTAPGVYVAKADWINHLRQEHNKPTAAQRIAEFALVKAAAQFDQALPTGAQTHNQASAGPVVNDIYLRLGTTRAAVLKADKLNSGTDSNLTVDTIGGLFDAVVDRCHGGNDIDAAVFLASLFEQLLITDAGENSFAKGMVGLVDSNSSAITMVKWEAVFAAFKYHGTTLDITITARALARHFAKDIYLALHQPGGSLAEYLIRPPTWATKYNTSEAWWAACSFFQQMKSASDWSPEERAMHEAHLGSITKISKEQGSSAMRYMWDASNNASSGSRLLEQMNKMAGAMVAQGDVDGLVKLKSLTTSRRFD